MRTRGHQQGIETEHIAVVQPDGLLVAIDLLRTPLPQRHAQICKMVFTLAQIGAAFVDVAHQKVRDGHARVRRFGLITDDGDAVRGGVLANGLSGDDTGRAGAENEVMGHSSPSRALVSAVGRPSASQPRAL